MTPGHWCLEAGDSPNILAFLYWYIQLNIEDWCFRGLSELAVAVFMGVILEAVVEHSQSNKE